MSGPYRSTICGGSAKGNSHLPSRHLIRCHSASRSDCPKSFPAALRNAFQEFTNRAGGLSSEDGIDARENEFKSAARDLANALGELLLVEGDDQGHVCDRVLR